MKLDWQAALMVVAMVGGGFAAGAEAGLAHAHGATAPAVVAPAAQPDCRDGAQRRATAADLPRSHRDVEVPRRWDPPAVN